MPEVTIVGGGMAGLSAALRLSERGYRVTMLEQDDHLGGKLGAYRAPGSGDYHEHSYHMYLNWYNNFWRIVDQLGLRDSFEPRTRISYLRKGEFPHTTALENVGAPDTGVSNLFSGVLTTPDLFIYAYSLIDLLTHDFRRDDFLQKISVNGFMHSRPYVTAAAAEHHSRTLAKAFASFSYRTSAASYQRFIKFGFRYPSPMMWLLKGNVHDFLLKHLEARLLENGCRIRKLTHVDKLILDESGRVRQLAFSRLAESPTAADHKGKTVGQGIAEVGDFLILAVPPGALTKLIDEPVFEVAPELGRVARLHAEPMASLDLYFNSRLPNMPKDPVVLLGSPLQLTFIDNAQLWPDERTTFLNVIASESEHLSALTKPTALRHILEELRTYVPFDWDQVDYKRSHLQYNLEDQLFINEVGSWENRPQTGCAIPNLFLAGDFCRTEIDVVTIEGAVSSGLLAAEAVRRCAGVGEAIECIVPDAYPEARLQVLKSLLAPHAYLAKAWATALEGARSAAGAVTPDNR